MFKLFWRNMRGAQDCKERDWRHDPLGHPVLLSMSARELADLSMVAEVPKRVDKVEVADACQRGGCRENLSGYAVSQ